jgi:hypothetical protein
MKTRWTWLAGILAALFLLGGPVWAVEKKEPGKKDGGKIAPVDDPALTGEPVQEQSEYEKLLFTEYRKRRTAHILFETSYDDDACKDYIAFCEQSYRDFLKWCGKPLDTDLWGTRAHIALIHNKAEWECLMTQITRGQPPHIVEGYKNAGGTHFPNPPTQFAYSREGSDPNQDKLSIFHNLNHLFLYGLTGSGNDCHVSWLWEAFSWHRTIEVFGSRGNSCFSFETKAKEAEDRAWNDIDDWVELLKRDVRTKQDEDFILFWHKDLMAIQSKTYVKAWGIIRYLVRDEKERAKFVNFVSMLKSSKDQARALKEAYGLTPDELDKAWREWIRNQPSRWRKSPEKKK